jgi:hypothetical protein
MTELEQRAIAARTGVWKAVVGVGIGVIVIALVVWGRFLSGVSAAPVPVSDVAQLQALPQPAASVSAAPASPTPTVGPTPASVSSAELPGSDPITPQLASPTAAEPRPDAGWLDATAGSTGISRRALLAYAGAELELQREDPGCGLGWNTLAAIGTIESNNGRVLTDAGYSTSPILGPSVDGGLHAEGPMQFMPATWTRWGADGNGDGIADPNQIDDAALAAARYLCSYGSLGTAERWHAAVFGYNHVESYVSAVAALASTYAARAAH